MLLSLSSVDIFLPLSFPSFTHSCHSLFLSSWDFRSHPVTGRIVSEECKETKNAYSSLAKLLVWQGLREGGKEGGREEKHERKERKEEMEKEGKERKESQPRVQSPATSFSSSSSFLQPVFEILSEHHLSLLVPDPSSSSSTYIYHSSAIPQPQSSIHFLVLVFLFTLEELYSLSSLEVMFTSNPSLLQTLHQATVDTNDLQV